MIDNAEQEKGQEQYIVEKNIVEKLAILSTDDEIFVANIFAWDTTKIDIFSPILANGLTKWVDDYSHEEEIIIWEILQTITSKDKDKIKEEYYWKLSQKIFSNEILSKIFESPDKYPSISSYLLGKIAENHTKYANSNTQWTFENILLTTIKDDILTLKSLSNEEQTHIINTIRAKNNNESNIRQGEQQQEYTKPGYTILETQIYIIKSLRDDELENIAVLLNNKTNKNATSRSPEYKKLITNFSKLLCIDAYNTAFNEPLYETDKNTTIIFGSNSLDSIRDYIKYYKNIPKSWENNSFFEQKNKELRDTLQTYFIKERNYFVLNSNTNSHISSNSGENVLKALKYLKQIEKFNNINSTFGEEQLISYMTNNLDTKYINSIYKVMQYLHKLTIIKNLSDIISTQNTKKATETTINDAVSKIYTLMQKESVDTQVPIYIACNKLFSTQWWEWEEDERESQLPPWMIKEYADKDIDTMVKTIKEKVEAQQEWKITGNEMLTRSEEYIRVNQSTFLKLQEEIKKAKISEMKNENIDMVSRKALLIGKMGMENNYYWLQQIDPDNPLVFQKKLWEWTPQTMASGSTETDGNVMDAIVDIQNKLADIKNNNNASSAKQDQNNISTYRDIIDRYANIKLIPWSKNTESAIENISSDINNIRVLLFSKAIEKYNLEHYTVAYDWFNLIDKINKINPLTEAQKEYDVTSYILAIKSKFTEICNTVAKNHNISYIDKTWLFDYKWRKFSPTTLSTEISIMTRDLDSKISTLISFIDDLKSFVPIMEQMRNAWYNNQEIQNKFLENKREYIDIIEQNKDAFFGIPTIEKANSEDILTKDFLIYPNPTSGEVKMILAKDINDIQEEYFKNLTINIFDISGKLISSKKAWEYNRNADKQNDYDIIIPNIKTATNWTYIVQIIDQNNQQLKIGQNIIIKI